MRKFMRTRGRSPPAPPAHTPAPQPHPHPHPHQHPHARPHTLLNGHANGHHANGHHANGHANGVNGSARRDDHHSTLSRYWSGSEGSRAQLWDDPEFPAAWRALGDKRAAAGVVWLRPHELCARPTFLNEAAAGSDSGRERASAGSDADDAGDADDAEDLAEPDHELAARWSVTVGALGDPHVCCAAAALALTPRLLARVAPPQTFRRRYTGAFRFKFWVFGAWREVAVDDRLPTRGGRALFSRGGLRDDFTLPLLEKAYAKLYGSYAALRDGSSARALQDLSGGIVQSFSLRRQPRALTFRVLNSAVPRSTLVVAGGGGSGGKCHVVVSVTQAYEPRARAKLRAIGFAVYELPPAAAPRRPLAHLHTLRALDVTHECRAREVVTFFTLPAGQYLVVPHTRRPHTDAAFLLRLFTDEHTDVWEVNEDNVIVRDISSEFHDDGQLLPAEVRASVVKMLGKREIDEVDAAGLRAALRRVWRWCLVSRPSLELCRALLALRDAGVSGRLRARDLPPLLALLAYWKHAYLLASGTSTSAVCARAACSAYRLRALLWAAGVTASNKVLECLVLRFARGARLSAEAYVIALARLHLAHERYRALDTKVKSNPLSLEEMILMTIYS